MKDKTDTHLQFWVTNKKQCSPDIPPLAQFNPASKIDLFIVLIFEMCIRDSIIQGLAGENNPVILLFV